MNERYRKDFGVERRLLRGTYTVTNTTMEIGKPDIQQVQKHTFELFAHGSLKLRHLTTGIAAAGICLTGYYLEKNYGLVSRVLGRGSAIYEVVFPKDSSASFNELFSSNTLEYELKSFFDNIEVSLKKLGCDDVVAELNEKWPKEFAKLKEIRLQSFELLNAVAVEKLSATWSDSEPEAKPQAAQAPQPPRSLKVDLNSQAPSTSILVYFNEPAEDIVDHYVIGIKKLAGADDDLREIKTAEQYAVIRGLQPRQSYFVWVQSECNGLLSKKLMLHQPVETAQFDPRPWRASESGFESVDVRTVDMYGGDQSIMDDDEAETRGDPEQQHSLWSTDLPGELRKIYPPSFTNNKLKRLLFKFDELGVAEAKDLKYFTAKDMADLLKEALKPIEILKLQDYATDSGTSGMRQDSDHRTDLKIQTGGGGTFFVNSPISDDANCYGVWNNGKYQVQSI